ncbi:copper resistance CopC family protein [Plantactinospora sp. KBS50]|uniref:copper resistance CopC family protein n=1 Tax=Plantactinospora sp. KBS50 TaxID=2024580 RepID=UPI000BAAA2AE|nr:copper resistance CopC family protein [Plantactinospora sp. KBS50]ASW54832.1 hypothetical protein CIK06_12525 [Plantactinospora sp. KBS50]
MATGIRRGLAGLGCLLIAALTVLLAPAGPAAAHTALLRSTPAADSRLSTAPKQITLEFLQSLDPAYTTIVLSDANRQRVPTGAPAVEGTKGTVTIDRPLGNGSYTVAYRVVSSDGHPVQGSYSFAVADPAASATPDSAAATDAPAGTDATGAAVADGAASGPAEAASGPAEATAAGSGGSGGTTLAMLAAGIAVAVAAGAAGFLLRRRTLRR